MSAVGDSRAMPGAGQAASSARSRPCRFLSRLGSGLLQLALLTLAGLLLAGRRCHELLAQTCNVNFPGLDPAQREAVMTQMVGVAVLVVHAGSDPSSGYRIWCDPTYAPYLWETLSDVAADLDNVGDEAHRAPQ